jgi:hypothetical protein
MTVYLILDVALRKLRAVSPRLAAIGASLLFAMVTATALAASPQSATTRLVILDDFDCLPSGTFGLASIRLRMAESAMLKRLGRPRSITKGEGEDDGGGYVVMTYHYPTLVIDVVREEVDRIHTSSARPRTPEGIRVGDTREEVAKILGKSPRHWAANEVRVWLVSCPEETEGGLLYRDDYVTYQFTPEDRVESITYQVERP